VSQEQTEPELSPVDEELTDDDVESNKMPLIEHLIELRNRLLW
ncbi:uncharacterized protein METZ01_LOCUS448578, partial [marine metagenome]